MIAEQEDINFENVLVRKPTHKDIFYITKIQKPKIWTKEEDDRLIRAARKFGFRNWNAISKLIPGRSSIQCTARYKRIKPGIVKGCWTPQEDENLLNLIEKFGRNWSLISKHMPSRNGKQIRDRYLNSLAPEVLKQKFTPEEDQQILDFYNKFGSSWSHIAKMMPGRTSDTIKNRFYSTLRKHIHSKEYYETLKKRKIKRERIKFLKIKDKFQEVPKESSTPARHLVNKLFSYKIEHNHLEVLENNYRETETKSGQAHTYSRSTTLISDSCIVLPSKLDMKNILIVKEQNLKMETTQFMNNLTDTNFLNLLLLNWNKLNFTTTLNQEKENNFCEFFASHNSTSIMIQVIIN
jgi:hypothetical protein